jgi:hypothetical protein
LTHSRPPGDCLYIITHFDPILIDPRLETTLTHLIHIHTILMRNIARRRLVLAGIMPPLDILQVTLAEDPHSILINLRLERQIPILILLLLLPMEH